MIPIGLLRILMHEPEPDLFSHGDRRAIEIAGMNAVMEIERRLGYIPTDVSATKCGYEIESEIQKTKRFNKESARFNTVKGSEI